MSPVMDLKLSGQEVASGYAEITSDFAYSTDNNLADVTGLAITFTPLQALVKLVCEIPYLLASTTAQTPQAVIATDANATIALAQESMVTSSLFHTPGEFAKRLSLTPGTSVTYKVRVKRGLVGASTVTIGAGTGWPAFIQAVYL